jgi:hypothetical protein
MSVCRDSEDASVASASASVVASAFVEVSGGDGDEDMVVCVDSGGSWWLVVDAGVWSVYLDGCDELSRFRVIALSCFWDGI